MPSRRQPRNRASSSVSATESTGDIDGGDEGDCTMASSTPTPSPMATITGELPSTTPSLSAAAATDHNRTVLTYLAALQARRRRGRIRPRPVDGAACGEGESRRDGSSGGAVPDLAGLLLGSVPLAGGGNDGSGDSSSSDGSPQRQQRLVRLIGAHNVALARYAAGDSWGALAAALPSFVEDRSVERRVGRNGDDGGDFKRQDNAQEDEARCRLAFLVLDCLLRLHRGSVQGMAPVSLSNPAGGDGGSAGEGDATRDEDVGRTKKEGSVMTQAESTATVTADSILNWIGAYASRLCDASGGAGRDSDDTDADADEMRFRLNLYRSRVAFQRTSGDIDARVRSARKDLKNAMEIYTHRLLAPVPSSSQQHHQQQKGHRRQPTPTPSEAASLAGGSVGSSSAGASSSRDPSSKASRRSRPRTPATVAVSSSSIKVSETPPQPSASPLAATDETAMLRRHRKGGEIVEKEKDDAEGEKDGDGEDDNVEEEVDDGNGDDPGLDARNQYALYLKADLEHLRGNTRKSLKLCAEARLAGEKKRLGEARLRARRRREYRDQERGSMNDDKEEEQESAHENESGVNGLDGEESLAHDFDEAVHHNDLAVLHQMEGRLHAAMHYYARALSYLERVERAEVEASANSAKDAESGGENGAAALFAADGSPRPPPVAEVLHNASLCALQAGNFPSAYECMARCVRRSPDLFGSRARCWLRMAEGCIGIHSQINRRRKNGSVEFRVARSGHTGTPSIVVVSDERARLVDSPDQGLSEALGNSEDVSRVLSNPLPRALFCLQRALRLCGNFAIDTPPQGMNGVVHKTLPVSADEDCIDSARLSIAYVRLELNDPIAALQMTNLVLQAKNPSYSAQSDGVVPKSWPAAKRMRCKAAARMYACEALCMLGDAASAMRVLGQSDAVEDAGSKSMTFDDTALENLARDYSMAPRIKSNGESDDFNPLEHTRLQGARSVVHVNASVTCASMKNIDLAKKHANMSHRLQPSDATTGTSLSMRSLLYCFLHEGDTEGALALLSASR